VDREVDNVQNDLAPRFRNAFRNDNVTDEPLLARVLTNPPTKPAMATRNSSKPVTPSREPKPFYPRSDRLDAVVRRGDPVDSNDGWPLGCG
jgi:hypothetical protein